MAHATHTLNKAALVASDCGMADLARQLCWQHIDTYRRIQRPLTIIEALYMLEPVLNLARLDIRAEHGTTALQQFRYDILGNDELARMHRTHDGWLATTPK